MSTRVARTDTDGISTLAGFTQWWFVRGGNIHGLWKRRKYSMIKDLAMQLPREAYKAGYEAALYDCGKITKPSSDEEIES